MCFPEGEEVDLGSGLEVFPSTRRLVEFKHRATQSETCPSPLMHPSLQS